MSASFWEMSRNGMGMGVTVGDEGCVLEEVDVLEGLEGVVAGGVGVIDEDHLEGLAELLLEEVQTGIDHCFCYDKCN